MKVSCLCTITIYYMVRRRVRSVVEHSSSNPRVPGFILGLAHTGVMDYDEACFMYLSPGVIQNFPKAMGV